MTNSIKILDCTLRDGGYIIDWCFGEKNIKSILENLSQSKVDFIECGFLKETSFNTEKTFFTSTKELEKIILPEQDYTLMVNYGEYDISNFKNCKNKNIKIRVAFKKHQQKEALEYISKLCKKNWKVFVNPMNTNTYSEGELKNLITQINSIKPLGLFIVDTLGNMYEKELLNIFKFLDENLDEDIDLGFHSHNNLQLSFSNSKSLVETEISRTIIIDSCIYGMGRGAGNLCTELFIKYLNDNGFNKYKISPILKCLEKNIKPFYEIKQWGYSTPYYIAALYGCHPNYANFLVEQNFSDENIEKFIKQIENHKKIIFDENYMKELTKKNF